MRRVGFLGDMERFLEMSHSRKSGRAEQFEKQAAMHDLYQHIFPRENLHLDGEQPKSIRS
jgi:hypothetical protein